MAEPATVDSIASRFRSKDESPIEARVSELRSLAKSDPEAAQDQTWDWFKELGKVRDEAKLDEIFALGKAPKGLDGQTDGILVAPFIQRAVDAGMNGIRALMPLPWRGKRFDADNNRGDNVLLGAARYPAKLIWPRYSTTKIDGGRAAFDFVTRTESGKHDPDTKVLVIDYAPVESNPDLIIRKIRDELVEVVPGANLGKILYRTGDDEYTNLGFFALRPQR